ncbi:MAG: hypothetical protein F4X63_08160 [Nitrospira sp. SB0662_bin_26]|nr:hypothetical protein [Nitrospira sp. SB0662_bin_26]
MDISKRAEGTILFEEGVILKAYPETENHTDIELAPGTIVGSIVRSPKTGRWRYDDTMRITLKIEANPDFSTDGEAANEIKKFLPPLTEIHALAKTYMKGDIR